MRRSHALALATLAITLTACGGAKDAPADGAATDAATAAPPPAAPANFDPSSITAAELALGDSLYHGLIGATSCQACHGADGKQATVAPDLTDGEWLHSDGSFEGIYKTVETGVMQPKQYTSVMPPYGGVPLTPDKTRAVAAYVYKLGHP